MFVTSNEINKIKEEEMREIMEECGQLQCLIQKKLGGNIFSWGSSQLSQYQHNFIDWYCFAHFQPFFSCLDVLNRTQGSSVFTSEVYQPATIFFFSSFLGIFFWAPITFEHYYFQSGCDPEI